jgi:uncharacterized protein (TIGR03000 family)
MTLGRILVRVPPDADVLFDGNATQQKGADRMFETPSLDPNKSYSYDVTAQWKDQNGQQHKEKRTVQPMPGRTVVVNFMQSQQGQPGSEQPLRKDSKNRPEIRDQDR